MVAKVEVAADLFLQVEQRHGLFEPPPVLQDQRLVAVAYATGRTIRDVALEKSGLNPQRIKALLDPETQAGE